MARKKRKAAEVDNEALDRDEDDALLDDELDEPDLDLEAVFKAPPPKRRGRDWRDVERFREERELRALINDDLDLDDDWRRPAH